MEKFLDFVGEACCLLSFVAPLIIVPVVWKVMGGNKVIRVIIGLILSYVCWWFLFDLSLKILVRNGMWSG